MHNNKTLKIICLMPAFIVSGLAAAFCGAPSWLSLGCVIFGYLGIPFWAMLEKFGLLAVITGRPQVRARRWYVYADLTPFRDRWGARHRRLVYCSRYFRLARLRAWVWADLHPWGSALVTHERLGPKALNA